VFLVAFGGLLAWSPWSEPEDATALPTNTVPPTTTPADPSAPRLVPPTPPGGGSDGSPDSQGGLLPDGALEDLLGGLGLEDLLQGSGLEDLLQGSGLEDLLGQLDPQDLLGDLNLEDLAGGEDGSGGGPFSGLPLPGREPATALFTVRDLPAGITEVGQSLSASGGTTRQVVTVAGREGRITIRGTVGDAVDTDVATRPGDDVTIDGWDGKLDESSLRIVVTWVEDDVLLELIAPVGVGRETALDIADGVETSR
jgi:hypothetical protein